jgi:hypothetical protein
VGPLVPLGQLLLLVLFFLLLLNLILDVAHPDAVARVPLPTVRSMKCPVSRIDCSVAWGFYLQKGRGGRCINSGPLDSCSAAWGRSNVDEPRRLLLAREHGKIYREINMNIVDVGSAGYFK